MVNFERLVLGCINAKTWKLVLVWISWKLSRRSTRFTLMRLWEKRTEIENTLLHRSEFKNSDKIRRTVTSSHFVTKFYSIINFSKLTLFCNCCPTFSNFEGEHFLEFQQFLIFFRNYLYEISLILNFPEISERILLIFPGNCFRKVNKNIRKIRSDLELEET